MLLILLAHLVTSALLVEVTRIRVFPKQGSVSGVFQVSLSSDYSFNASVAREVCDGLGVAMADKKQVEKALARGFETCRFGWTDEQVAVIPRVRSKESCGQGKVGIITWRTPLSTPFDVFCFNSTDYEAHMNPVQETPSTAVTPTPHVSGHPKPTKTTRSASRDDLQLTSFSLPASVNDTPESQAFSNASTTTAAGLTALLTTVFAFLLLAVAAVCYFKKNSTSRRKESQQKENMETEICGTTRKETETRKLHNMNTNDVRVTINPENDNGESS